MAVSVWCKWDNAHVSVQMCVCSDGALIYVDLCGNSMF